MGVSTLQDHRAHAQEPRSRRTPFPTFTSPQGQGACLLTDCPPGAAYKAGGPGFHCPGPSQKDPHQGCRGHGLACPCLGLRPSLGLRSSLGVNLPGVTEG